MDGTNSVHRPDRADAGCERSGSDMLVAKFGAHHALDAEDVDALHALNLRIEAASSGMIVVEEGEPVRSSCLLIDGYSCRSKITRQGGRQIVSLHIPGDFFDLQHLLIDVADHSVEAIAPIRFVRIPKPQLQALVADRPTLGMAVWRETLVEASRFREWIANVGRRDALSRVAHLLCEIAIRSVAQTDSPFPMSIPMTQVQIADASGLTPVHVNRILRQLADLRLIGARRPQVELIDLDGLMAISDFDVGYLHLPQVERD